MKPTIVPVTPPSIKPQFPRSGTFGKILNRMKPLNHEEGRSEKLYIAIENNNIDEVKRLIDAGVDVKKYSPLVDAAAANNIEIVRILITAGADVDTAEVGTRLRPLHLAAKNGNIDMVRELLAADANINVTEQDNMTPLHIALIEGHHDIMELLLKSGANTETLHIRGYTPIYDAVRFGDIDAVRLLLRAGANVNKMSRSGAGDIFFEDVDNRTVRDIVRLLRGAGLGYNYKFYTKYDGLLKETPSGGSRKNKKKNKKRKTRRV